MKHKSDYLINYKNLHQLQVENMTVKFKYSDSGKKINECMLNVLKRKLS